MIKKTADGVEIVKGMKVWISPLFELADGGSIGILKTKMDEHIVSSLSTGTLEGVYLKRGEYKMRWTGFLETIYADKKKAIENRIDIGLFVCRGCIY